MNQTTAVTTYPKHLAVMGERLKMDPPKVDGLLRSLVMPPGSSDQHMLALCVIANEYALNPVLREIYCIKTKAGYQAVVGVDGWVKVVQSRRKEWDGMGFNFGPEIENVAPHGKPAPEWVECSIKLKGMADPIVIREYFREVYRPTDNWASMPYRMARHKAMIQCARVAFGFAGIYEEDDFIDVETEPPTKLPQAPSFLGEVPKTPPPTPAPTPTPRSTPPPVDRSELDLNQEGNPAIDPPVETLPPTGGRPENVGEMAPEPPTYIDAEPVETEGLANTLHELTKKLREANLTESDLLAFMKSKKMAEENVTSLTQVAHGKLLQILAGWNKAVGLMKEPKK